MQENVYPKPMKERAVNALLLVLMWFLVVIMVLPFIWMLSTSFKENGRVLIFPPQWIPDPWLWENYGYTWTAANMGLYFKNSLIVTLSLTVGQTVTCSLAAYAFSRLNFKGRDLLFLIYLGTMMIPFQVTLIPLYILMRQFGWIDTYKSLIVPFIFSAYNTFLLRQSFLTIPRALDESAIIDGCGYFGIYSRIILPLSRPALITQAIFCALWAWNDLLWPTVVVNTERVRTLVVGLQMFKTAYAIQWNYLMAGTCISVIPMLILYLFCQKYFVEGISTTGIKG